MYSYTHKIRVRYAETDKMGYLYYGNYAMYYEVGRVETMRSLGIQYKKMEDEGIMLPVLELKSKFIKPAFYDEELTVKTTIIELPKVRITFEYEIKNEKDELINFGSTILVHYDWKKQRPCMAPDYILEILKPYFANDVSK